MNKIKEFREARKMTQRELAADLGITDDYLSTLERGAKTPGFKLGKKIADYFNVSIDEMNYFCEK